ncbi:MAG: carbohydrate binding domain-containing protein [Tannerella sp.]|jgi:hypothetical protein|nr:carbohydrate binding domain-containing protein [Tannerella sp.]
MKNLYLITVLIVLASCAKTSDYDKAQWHYPLYMANDDYWRQRVPIDIRNNTGYELAGAPVELPVRQVSLAGMLAEGVRVVDPNGIELTFRITDKEDNVVERGPIPADGRLVIPVECTKDASAVHYVYFDNPSAWAIGDFYKTHSDITNGSFENQTVYGPTAWKLSLPAYNNRVEQVDDEAHIGNKSICISVGNSDKKPLPTADQTYIHLFSGAEYTVEGWVKGADIKGEALVSVVFGDLNTEDFNLGTEQISAGSGAFDWKKVALKFTVPEKVSGATLRLALEGTGKVWFDDMQISCNQGYNVVADVLKKEALNLKAFGKTEDWYGEHSDKASSWQSRTAVSTFNFGTNDISGKLLCVDIEEVVNRLHAEMTDKSMIQVTDGTTPLPFYRAGDYLLFKQDVKGASVQTNYVYFNKYGSETKSQIVHNLNELNKNLVTNPDFETDDLTGWQGDTDSPFTEISSVSKTGTKSIQLSVSGQNNKEVKIEQTLPVNGGTIYFFSAWMKCTDMIQQPDFLAGINQRTLRAQFMTADGKNAGDLRRIAVSPERHIDNTWSHLFMLITAPSDAASIKLQLANNAIGTVWFDDVIFTDVVTASTSPLAIERLGARDIKELTVWQEDPIVKVFPDDLPPRSSGKISISLAKNEVEPLQLVLRSPREYRQLEIKVINPADAQGNELAAADIGVVGYVPVNYPSNYISFRNKTYWQQKLPVGRIGSDGWRGYWPDPILPFARFDLKADVSQPVWIEFQAPSEAAAGMYNGKIQLVDKGEALKEIPFTVKVRNFALPDESHVIAEYDARVNTWDFYGSSKSEMERIKEIWKILAGHRLNPDCVKPDPTWTVENGEVKFDFTEFDRAAEYYFNVLKLQRMYAPWYFYLFGWANLPPDKFGEPPYEGVFPYEGVDRSKLRPEYIKVYQSAVRNYWNHLKEKGWADKFILYISDEPHADAEITQQMHAICDMIHAVDSKIPIYVSTWWYRPEYKGYVDVWGVSNHGGSWGRSVPVSDLENIKRIGGRLWFTTDGKMCTDTPFLGFERLLPYYCFKYGAEEYEFWGSNWYTFNPYEYGWHGFIRQSDRPGDLYWIRYPNGDANFIYPGLPIGVEANVPTIRLKLAREGVEDYEYLYILDNLVKEAKKQGKNVADAEKALADALDVITIPSSEGRYSTEYLKDPYAVMQVRNQVAEAIENFFW